MGGVGGKRGLWGFVRGGMGAVTSAMADSARSRGASIRVNAAVERILARGGRARGVVLAGGEEIAAPVVVSNLDPVVTFRRLVDEKDLDAEMARHQIHWVWVAGHSGHPENERADQLARDAVPR